MTRKITSTNVQRIWNWPTQLRHKISYSAAYAPDRRYVRTPQMAALFCMKWLHGRYLESRPRRRMENPTPSIDAYLLERQSAAKFHPDPKRHSLAWAFLKTIATIRRKAEKNKNNKMSSDMRSVHGPKNSQIPKQKSDTENWGPSRKLLISSDSVAATFDVVCGRARTHLCPADSHGDHCCLPDCSHKPGWNHSRSGTVAVRYRCKCTKALVVNSHWLPSQISVVVNYVAKRRWPPAVKLINAEMAEGFTVPVR